MKPRYPLLIQHLLLCLAVALAYSPAFRAEPCLLDDVAMLKGLQEGSQPDFSELLIPNFAHSAYYRPLIGLSYWLSHTLWNADPQAMHMENVAFHTLNVLLLFWLIRLSLPDNAKFNRYLPFLGALLFAVHPITTESVNWISGRTDLLAGSCLLGAGIAIAAWQRKQGHWWLAPLALLLLAAAILTKEVAWGFLLALPFFLFPPHDSGAYTFTCFLSTFSTLEKLLLTAGIALCFFLAVVTLSLWPSIALSVTLGLIALYRKPRHKPLSKSVFLLLPISLISLFALLAYLARLAKQHAAEDYYSTVSRTVLLVSVDINNSITLFSAALAFYIKKFFLPLPLNFAITDISSGYLFAGIAVIITTIFLCIWRSKAALLFLAGIALVLPALPLLHGEIAWSPYAERYIYISSGFWIASLVVGLGSLTPPSLRAAGLVTCLFLIPVAAFATCKRSIVWQANVSLFEDTVKKSPKHLKARILYMVALENAGDLTESLAQYRHIQSDLANTLPVKYANNLARLLYDKGMKREAYEVLQTALAKPLPPGQRHPLPDDDWRQLYEFHLELQ